jgi:hypothetical protein
MYYALAQEKTTFNNCDLNGEMKVQLEQAGHHKCHGRLYDWDSQSCTLTNTLGLQLHGMYTLVFFC